jgi:LCP family protein required for cell wall assembly
LQPFEIIKVGVGVMLSKQIFKDKKSASTGKLSPHSGHPKGSAIVYPQSTPVSVSGTARPSLQPASLPRRLFQGFALVTTATISVAIGAGVALFAPVALNLGTKSNQPGIASLWHTSFQYNLTRPVNILVMGIDRVPEAIPNSAEIFAGRSDTLLLLRLDPTQSGVSMLSIPRDTQVEIPGIGMSKINEANVAGGPALSAQVIRQNLNQVAIDRYVRVSTDAFRELVDQLGGVKVYVPFPMSYEDRTQKLKIDLDPGWQTLNGRQAEQFARFRHDGYGDIGRVQRQQTLLKALREKLADPMTLPRLPGVIQVMQKYIDTNLSFEEILTLAQFGLKLKQDQSSIKMVMLPGHFSSSEQFAASYWLINPTARDRVMRDYFQVHPPAAENSEIPAAADTFKTLNIAIQNASNQPGLGRRVAQRLEDQGFAHVYVIEDWTEPVNQTQIIVQQGDTQAAQGLQNFLGLGQVDPSSTGDLESDLTIRIGNDWETHSRVSP